MLLFIAFAVVASDMSFANKLNVRKQMFDTGFLDLVACTASKRFASYMAPCAIRVAVKSGSKSPSHKYSCTD